MRVWAGSHIEWAWHNARLAVGVMTVVTLLSPIRVNASTWQPPAYSVTPIGALSLGESSYAVGVNNRGDVAGEIGSGRSYTPFLYRNGHVSLIPSPKDISQLQVVGLNDADVLSAQAFLTDGRSGAFAIVPRNGGFNWVALTTASPNDDISAVADVAANGDIAGGITIHLAHGGFQIRSVIWKALPAGRYAVAKLLPLANGYNISISGGVWIRKGTTYVAGAQGNGSLQSACLWSPSPSLTSLANGTPFITTIGGVGGEVYGAGMTFVQQGGSYAWVARIAFNKAGGASLRRPVILPGLGAYGDEVGLGVSVDAQGNPIVVGGAPTTAG